uniref:Uncharacterized protein n=1 Tax=Setaria viridis TaxID=4556 RepID=A0A4U6SYU5_SETVI|nr:hypothetical protein SEVIR_9G244666v2 [Setaria viridis]
MSFVKLPSHPVNLSNLGITVSGYDYYLYLTPISRHTSRFPITWFFQ